MSGQDAGECVDVEDEGLEADAVYAGEEFVPWAATRFRGPVSREVLSGEVRAILAWFEGEHARAPELDCARLRVRVLTRPTPGAALRAEWCSAELAVRHGRLVHAAESECDPSTDTESSMVTDPSTDAESESPGARAGGVAPPTGGPAPQSEMHSSGAGEVPPPGEPDPSTDTESEMHSSGSGAADAPPPWDLDLGPTGSLPSDRPLPALRALMARERVGPVRTPRRWVDAASVLVCLECVLCD